MPASVGGEYLRNVAAYVGVSLVVGALSTTASLAVPWLWFGLAVTLGQVSERGVSEAAWWAYPLQEGTWHPEVAVGLLCIGVAVRAVRG